MIDESYVLASQASQVFYVEDVRHKDWMVVVKTKPREVFDVGIEAIDDDEEMDTYMENVPYNVTIDDACDNANDNHAWARVNEEGTIYNTPLISENELLEQDFINDEELSDDIISLMMVSPMMIGPMMISLVMMTLVVMTLVNTFVSLIIY